jgi:aromatic-L-amino-acid decarboxylase
VRAARRRLLPPTGDHRGGYRDETVPADSSPPRYQPSGPLPGLPLPGLLHGPRAAVDGLEADVSAFIAHRLRHEPPLGRSGSPQLMGSALHGAITETGIGAGPAWELFVDRVVPNAIAIDSSRFLAFIPMSPSAASVWMDAAMAAASFSAESWLEAAGAVAAEVQILDLLADAAGMPAGAGGCFLSGGSVGNLSALAVGRAGAGGRRGVAVADTAHASVRNSIDLLGLEAVVIPTGAEARLTGDALRAAIGARSDVGIIVASAGSTNAGIIDDLAGIAEVAEELGAWLHVDGAYGAAALLLPEMRAAFAGIGRADSFIVDPHKWLFAPAGSCALLYRRPQLAAAVHTQRGPYIDVLHDDDGETLNPCDLGYQLTRRASGLPLWFALAVHGLEAHRQAIRAGISLAAEAADRLAAVPGVKVVLPPQLGVVLFRRAGWGKADWQVWARQLLDAGSAFVAPTTFRGEPVGRLVFMHPLTPRSLIDELAASVA